MADLGPSTRKPPRWVTFLTQSLLTLGALAVVSIAIAMTGEEPDLDEGEDDPTSASSGRRVAVWSLAFSADDTHLASVTIGGDVWLKTLKTGRSRRVCQGRSSSTRSVAFSPDGQVLAIAGGEPVVRVLDIETAEELPALEVGGERTKWIAFSSDGSLLAVAHEIDERVNGIVTLWDWASRRRVARLDGRRGSVVAMSFSPDGSLLAVAGSEGLITLWDVANGRERAALRVREWATENTSKSALSPDGSLLAEATFPGDHVQLWDLCRGELRGKITIRSPGVGAIAFSFDGRRVAMGGWDGSVTLVDATTGRGRITFGGPGPSLQSLAFSHDGRRLATGDARGAVHFWDLAQPPRRFALQPNETGARSRRLREGEAQVRARTVAGRGGR